MSEDRSPIDSGESPQAAVERLLCGVTEPDVGMLNGGRLSASNAVLRWLQGSTADPWSGGAGCGDQDALEQIRHKLDSI